MEVIMLSEENRSEYEGILPGDLLENIGREFYGGMVAESPGADRPLASAIWEMKHLEDEGRENEGVLHYFSAEDPEAGKVLLEEYEAILKEQFVEKSTLELPMTELKEEKDLLSEAGYDLSESEAMTLEEVMENLEKLPIMKNAKVPNYINRFGTLLERAFQRGLMNFIFQRKREIIDDLAYLPFDWYEPRVSCYTEMDEKAIGFLLVHETGSGALRIELLGASGPSAKNDLFHMIRFSILQASNLYSSSTRVLIPRRDDMARQLTAYFFPGKRGEICLCGTKEVKRS